MWSSVTEILAVVLPSLFTGGALVVFLAKNWFLEHLRSSIRSEYDQKLERVKADLSARNATQIEELKASLAKDISVISAVQKSFSDSYNSAQTHRVQSIKELWDALLCVQRNTPAVFTFLDVLPSTEYGETLGTRKFKTFSDISQDDIMKMIGGKVTEAQSHRLLAGEYLWSLFSAYLALSARIAIHFQSGRANQNVTPWYEDSGCISIVQSVCTASEFAKFQQLQFGRITSIRGFIESKFLSSANRILNGQASSDIAIEEANRIVSAIMIANQNGS
ncbi:MAG: hypothetical protein JZU70_03875 [Chlorobium sp.]|jgi:hypothetical protein|nr:hypothetical protein [Chlorobium sp.]